MSKIPHATTDALPKPERDSCCGGQHVHGKPAATAKQPTDSASTTDSGEPRREAAETASKHVHTDSGCCGGSKPSA